YADTPWLGRMGLSERPTTAMVLAVFRRSATGSTDIVVEYSKWPCRNARQTQRCLLRKKREAFGRRAGPLDSPRALTRDDNYFLVTSSFWRNILTASLRTVSETSLLPPR